MGKGTRLDAMVVRRSAKQPDLRKLPIDGTDMFLLSRLEGELTVAELADMVGACDPSVTESRVEHLVRLGLIERVGAAPEVSAVRNRPRRSDADAFAAIASSSPPGAEVNEDGIITLPPPAPEVDLEAATLRPARPSSAVDLDSVATLRPPAPQHHLGVPVFKPLSSLKDLQGQSAPGQTLPSEQPRASVKTLSSLKDLLSASAPTHAIPPELPRKGSRR